MRIDRIEELRLTPDDEAQIAGLLARCFTTDFGGRTTFRQRHHLRLVARDPDIIGHIAITYRDIRQGNHLIPVICVAEVATAPEHRGKGVAVSLLSATLDEGRQSPAQFVLLFGDAALYRAAGFEPARNRMRFVDITGARTGQVEQDIAESLMVLPLRNKHWDAGTMVDMLGHLF